MIQVQRTYKVKENDTINSVAKQHGLDVKELITYHNNRVESHDKIRNRIPDFLREIVIPPEGYIIKNGKAVWGNPNEPEPNILTNPFTGLLQCSYPNNDLVYGVFKTIKNGEKDKLYSKMTYTLTSDQDNKKPPTPKAEQNYKQNNKGSNRRSFLID